MRDRSSDHHRTVAAAVEKRPLGPDEIVHHKDEDKANNTPANLEVVPRGEHTRNHNRSRGLSKLRAALRGQTPKLY